MRCYDDVHKKTDAQKTSNRLTVSLLVLMIGLVLFTTFFMGSAANSNDLEKYDRITVQSGDTLWDLLESYVQPEEDIRNLILQVKRINDLESAKIFPGQIILIPAS